MYDFRRHLTTLCAVAGLALVSGRAQAWVESEMRSQTATVDVDRAGKAIVTEELTLSVRGGPLPGFELRGVDLDAEPLPGASVSSLPNSKVQLPQTPLLLDKRDDGSLRIEVDREKGLRTGVYSFRFQYRTDLLARDLIRREGNEVIVRWIGPRFEQGIDSARVVFRLPAGPTPPVLPDMNDSAGRLQDGDALGGVFISNLHRLADKDELDVVRPHVSRGEPVLWRVRVSAKAFDAFANPTPAPRLEKSNGGHALSLGSGAQPRQRLGWWLGAALSALAYACAVAGKSRYFSAMCAARAALPRALVPLPVGLRAAASGTLVAAALIGAAWFDQPTLGAALLVSAMALACQYARPAKLVLRGPGQWLALSDREAFSRERALLAGRFLDAGTWPGFALFAALCAGSWLAAWFVFAHAPYQALLLVLGSACLLPLFFTGRVAELPEDLAIRPRALLWALATRLRRAPGVKVVAWARIPEGRAQADELRLLVQVPGALRGLLGVEVGVEYGSAGGSVAAPFVLVRAREGSRVVEALPKELVWTRGRKADERAAVLRPRLPTVTHCEQLVLELIVQLREAQQAAGQRPGSGRANAHTAASRSVLSPAHVL
ncbi:MAG TPA: hypothetical protein VFK05_36975 [Polyangiaceae bacterium]|nr:hypothetical protein [Polyangiaceae bacterium]